MHFAQQSKRRAFTLLEIMVVVIIIGVMLAMAIPGFKAVRERSRVAAFTSDFRAVKEAINRYSLEEGHYPIGTGGPSADFYEYIREDVITGTTVIGGNWTADVDTYIFAIGVADYQVDDDLIEQIDAAVDDGNTASGKMTISGPKTFLFVIEE
ncbi:type II secretion system protein [Cerasicoccus maritimus]|uniref:type II secretion system protein n=1 Tax=Cerasicoccus maritimus TaxID=490089 RepID=UPI0028525165|nr:prepilin-type N-terminal cleavage/methylation domain-containing protein [Cerasicoccus maritimus]